jgi:hypothetical protein
MAGGSANSPISFGIGAEIDRLASAAAGAENIEP